MLGGFCFPDKGKRYGHEFQAIQEMDGQRFGEIPLRKGPEERGARAAPGLLPLQMRLWEGVHPDRRRGL